MVATTPTEMADHANHAPLVSLFLRKLRNASAPVPTATRVMGGQKNGMQNIAARTAVRFHDRAGIVNSSLDVGVLVLNCGFEISFMRIICFLCWR
jgi:hypothetical protein